MKFEMNFRDQVKNRSNCEKKFRQISRIKTTSSIRVR